MNIFKFLQSLIFVTDCDNTIVHYDSGSSPTSSLVQLPASSGSGRSGFISSSTLEKLDEISKYVPIVCASGMRAATMMQRAPFIPHVSYWICENGGRIFVVENGEIHEVFEWKAEYELEHGERIKDMLHALKIFSEILDAEGWTVDARGYDTMVRIRGENVEALVPRIPSGLSFTFNLGHLDIQLPGISKLIATRWLISRFYPQSSGDFYFMGDDTNDIEIAAVAKRAFIAMPCSEKMQEWVTSQNYCNPGDHSKAQSNRQESKSVDSQIKLVVASADSHEGTVMLLSDVIHLIQNANS